MNKEEYFNRSKKEKLTCHCPLVGRCERYANTIYNLGELFKLYRHGTSVKDVMIGEGLFSKKTWKKRQLQIGEGFLYMQNNPNTTYYFKNACPEVTLFDKSVFAFLPENPAKAISAGSWDKERPDFRFGTDKKFEVLQTKHFSECAEYSSFIFHYNNSIKTKASKGSESVYEKGHLIDGEEVNNVLGENLKLTIRQAAYLLAYQNKGIRDPRSDSEKSAEKCAKELCKNYSPSTGIQLYAKFDKLRSQEQRQKAFNSELNRFNEGQTDTRSMKAILKDLRAIIPHLKGGAKIQAETDLSNWNRMYSDAIE